MNSILVFWDSHTFSIETSSVNWHACNAAEADLQVTQLGATGSNHTEVLITMLRMAKIIGLWFRARAVQRLLETSQMAAALPIQMPPNSENQPRFFCRTDAIYVGQTSTILSWCSYESAMIVDRLLIRTCGHACCMVWELDHAFTERSRLKETQLHLSHPPVTDGKKPPQRCCTLRAIGSYWPMFGHSRNSAKYLIVK